MKSVRATATNEGEVTTAKDWMDSCDHCASQEGHHYCLLHGRHMKNMNLTRCAGWTPKPAPVSKPSRTCERKGKI